MPTGKQADTRTDEEIGSALTFPMKDLDALLKSLVETAEENTSDEMTATEIVNQILQAETEDDVLGGEVFHVEDFDYDDKGWSKNKFELLGNLRIQPSSFGGKGIHYYCVIDCKVDDEKTVFVTSAANICAQLVKLMQLEAYPKTVRVRHSHSRPRTDAPMGYDVYRLSKARKVN